VHRNLVRQRNCCFEIACEEARQPQVKERYRRARIAPENRFRFLDGLLWLSQIPKRRHMMTGRLNIVRIQGDGAIDVMLAL
jgi:hypothetical protein